MPKPNSKIVDIKTVLGEGRVTNREQTSAADVSVTEENLVSKTVVVAAVHTEIRIPKREQGCASVVGEEEEKSAVTNIDVTRSLQSRGTKQRANQPCGCECNRGKPSA